MLLSDKKAVITGGSIGLGKAIAEEFVKQGAHALICARNEEQLEDARKGLLALRQNSNQIIEAKSCDVSKQNEVEELFSHARKVLNGLDILVNNAGILGPKGSSEAVNAEDWIKTVEVNLYGTFFTCQKAISIFKEQKHGKIINLSGGGATSPRPNFSAYAASKTAVVRLTENLAQEVHGFGIDINAIAPGALNTRLLDEVLDAGPEKVGEKAYQQALKQQQSGGAPPEKAAQLCVYLASSQSNGISGKLISAIWDSWRDFNNHREDIENTDIYTLRRIIPKEREMDWE